MPRRSLNSLRALALAAIVAAALPAQAQSRKPMTLPQASALPANGVIVKLRDAGATESAQAVGSSARSPSERLQGVAKTAGVAGASVTRTVGRAQLLDVGHWLSGSEAAALAAKLAAQPEVEWAEPNTRQRRLSLAPNDPYFGSQWWLQPASLLQAERLHGLPGYQTAWSLTTGSSVPAARVAVLDTGITSHPDLAAHVLPGYDFVSADADGGFFFANDGNGRDADASDPGDWMTQADIDSNPTKFSGCIVEPSSWHGTDISGLIAAVTDNAEGIAGINQDGRILPVRVAGRCGATLADIADGIRWAAGLTVAGVPVNPTPARIINISFGGSEPCGNIYQSAIDDVAKVNAVIVAAAGNEQGALTRPANCSGVVAVGAVNRDGFKTNYSNFGAGVTVMTVGGDPSDFGRWGPALGDGGLLGVDNAGSTTPGSPGYAYLSGTSFSAPLVSGAISLMLSANPGLSVAQIIDGLKRSARPHVGALRIGACSANNPGRCICTTNTCGAGLLDASEAVKYALAQNNGVDSYTAPKWPVVVLDNADINAAAALGPDADPIQTTPPPPTTPSPGSSDGGGGALGAGWLAGLALAVLALRWQHLHRRLRRIARARRHG